MKQLEHFCVADIFLKNEHDEILMIKRNGNKGVLPNFYNGIGGKIEKGETPLQAVLREADEEAGAKKIDAIKMRANLTINDKFGFWQVYVFEGLAKKNAINIKEMHEGALEWIPIANIESYNLVEDLRHWLLNMLEDKNIFQFVNAKYDDNYKLLDIKIESLS